jgi:putative FmdB family regulatory protein
MPSYDFECKSCNFVFTITRSMNDTHTPDCPQCHKNTDVQRVWGCVNFGGMSNKVNSSSSCTGCSGGSCSTCH